jgi:hypothetical protein
LIKTDLKRSRAALSPWSAPASQSYRLIKIRSLRDDLCPKFRQTSGAPGRFGKRPNAR